MAAEPISEHVLSGLLRPRLGAGALPEGNGPFEHSDLAGNLFDLTSTIAGSAGHHPDDRELTWGRNGAWEGHEIPFAAENGPWTAPIMRKYGKAGGRCVKAK